MEDQFKQVVDNARSILVLLPTQHAFDDVAAGLGLFLALREDKDIQIVSPSPMTVDFNRLVGINKITQDLGDKNLIIKFLDYNPKDIERVKYDLEEGHVVYLSVIPMPGKKAPAKDQVHLSYSGVAADTVFLVGGTDDSHFPQLGSKDLAGSKIAHIGIKDINLSGGKQFLSFARPASSVSELVYSLLRNSDREIDQDVASDLLMGIEESTNNFTDTNTTGDTFIAVGDLMKRGARRMANKPQAQATQFPPGSIPVLPRMPHMQVGQQPIYQPMPQNFPPIQPQAQFPVQSQIPRPQRQPIPQRPPLPQQPAPIQPEEQNQPSEEENPPEEWLTKPKVYKGTSVS